MLFYKCPYIKELSQSQRKQTQSTLHFTGTEKYIYIFFLGARQNSSRLDQYGKSCSKPKFQTSSKLFIKMLPECKPLGPESCIWKYINSYFYCLTSTADSHKTWGGGEPHVSKPEPAMPDTKPINNVPGQAKKKCKRNRNQCLCNNSLAVVATT